MVMLACSGSMFRLNFMQPTCLPTSEKHVWLLHQSAMRQEGLKARWQAKQGMLPNWNHGWEASFCIWSDAARHKSVGAQATLMAYRRDPLSLCIIEFVMCMALLHCMHKSWHYNSRSWQKTWSMCATWADEDWTPSYFEGRPVRAVYFTKWSEEPQNWAYASVLLFFKCCFEPQSVGLVGSKPDSWSSECW